MVNLNVLDKMFLEIVSACTVPILIYALGVYIQHLLKCRKLPPGPFPLPLIGNLHLLGSNPHRGLAKVANTYGDIFSFSFGMERFVIVCELNAIKEVLIQKDVAFGGRPKSYVAEISTCRYQGLSLGNYRPVWKLMHKIVQSSLKVFEEGKGTLEKIVEKESEELNKRILKKSNKVGEVNIEIGIYSFGFFF